VVVFGDGGDIKSETCSSSLRYISLITAILCNLTDWIMLVINLGL
jgi:hypothetical protein